MAAVQLVPGAAALDSGIATFDILDHFRFGSESFGILSQGTWDGVHGWTMILLFLLVLCCFCAGAPFRVSTKDSAGERTKYHYRGNLGTRVWGKLCGAAKGLFCGFSLRQGTDAPTEHHKSSIKNYNCQRARKGTNKQRKELHRFTTFLGMVVLKSAYREAAAAAAEAEAVAATDGAPTTHQGEALWTMPMVDPTPTYTYGTRMAPTTTHRPTSSYDPWSHDHP